MDGLELALTDKDPMVYPASKVDNAVDGAIVLAVWLVELDAYPFADLELGWACEADDAPALGNGDD
jgi:hypothetical protein